MKKAISIVLTIFVLLLSSCTYPFTQIRNSYDSVWVSTKPEMRFTVPPKDSDISVFGSAELEDGTIVTFKFNGRQSIIYFACIDQVGNETAPYLKATCKIKGNKLVLDDIKTDTFYNFKYDEIVFYREDIED